MKPKAKFRPGDAFFVPVKREHIDESEPCNKENCMVNRASLEWFKANYGDRNYKMKSTNHGIVFQLNGRRYVAVFDTKSAYRIYNYDQVFRQTHSKEKARSSIKPFKVRMMVESSTVAIKWPRMPEEVKQKLRSMPRPGCKPKAANVRRQLSL